MYLEIIWGKCVSISSEKCFCGVFLRILRVFFDCTYALVWSIWGTQKEFLLSLSDPTSICCHHSIWRLQSSVWRVWITYLMRIRDGQRKITRTNTNRSNLTYYIDIKWLQVTSHSKPHQSQAFNNMRYLMRGSPLFSEPKRSEVFGTSTIV
jgi:hypothetical protein